MGSLFKKPKAPPPPPEPPAAPPPPDPSDPGRERALRQKVTAKRQASGRASTVLSDKESMG